MVVVHGRLIGEEPGDGGAEFVSNRLFVSLVCDLDEPLGRFGIERIDIVRNFFLQEIEQPPLSLRRLPRDHLVE